MILSESSLKKLSLAGIVVGLILLYFFSTNLSAKQAKIGEMDKSLVGSFVNITGDVTDFRKADSGMFFNLKDGGEGIKVVVWNNIVEQLELGGVNTGKIREGAKINLVGIVQVYKGSLEVIPVRGDLRILG
ncbi:MAG TPA: exodeoxyribonuclease VII large subunit [archaeon]|nr:exodeoxyribonuclease VII large subunit [archaeon]